MDNKSFDYKRIAEGYKDRPFLHKNVMEQFQADMGEGEYENGLDVGCGAGLSTKGLQLICKNVTGTDISEEMISVAKEVCTGREYQFFTCGAEEIPKPDKLYDIVTAAGMVQWVNIDKFLQCMTKIMSKDAMLLIYDFGITDQMLENDKYNDWWHSQYLVKFPKPYRNETIWKQDDVSKHSFKILKQVTYDMEYEFDMESFIKFMMIQSNVNAKIEGENQNIEEVKRWFVQTLTPIFRNQNHKLVFRGYSWYLQHVSNVAVCSIYDELDTSEKQIQQGKIKDARSSLDTMKEKYGL